MTNEIIAAPQFLSNNEDDWEQGIAEMAAAAEGDEKAIQQLKDRYEALTPLAKGEGGLHKLEKFGKKNPFKEVTAPEHYVGGMSF